MIIIIIEERIVFVQYKTVTPFDVMTGERKIF